MSERERCKTCGQPRGSSRHIQYGNDLDNPVKHQFEAEQRERGGGSAKDAWDFYFNTEAGTKLNNSDVSNDGWQGAMEFAEAYASSRLAQQHKSFQSHLAAAKQEYSDLAGEYENRANNAEARLAEVSALIDELRLKATGLADESGFNVTYDVPAGLLHKFLGWRSGASYSPKAALGTYACPICGRDTPHTAQTHADHEERKKAGFYQQWLHSLTEEERNHFFSCRDGHCERCDGFSNIAVKMRGLDERAGQPLAEVTAQYEGAKAINADLAIEIAKLKDEVADLTAQMEKQ